MSSVITAKAYTNGEVGYLAWQVSGMIHGCLGFAITRIFSDGVTPTKPLAAWVPFKGQSNPDWDPQDTTVWPVQKLSWRDLTLVKSRDTLNARAQGFKVSYLIRPVVAMGPGLTQIPVTLPVTYKGGPVPLAYFDEGLETNEITVSTQFGNIRATFTNGILATQWLANVLKNAGGSPLKTLQADIAVPGNAVRNYLAGPVLDTLKELLLRAQNNPAATLRMALYEFDDTELKNTILSVKGQVEMILSNTSKNSKGLWDVENDPFRKLMHSSGVNITDRFFNNDHIGHNKFVIYLEGGVPKSVMTGSTNWTPNGLCAQSNNAAIIDSPEIAAYYNAYFDALKTDTALFKLPAPTSATTKNVQGSLFRSLNAKGNLPVTLADNTKLTIWFSPNAGSGSTDTTTIPPDLSAVYSLMRKAEKAIFFAVFLPGMSDVKAQGDIMTNIITEAVTIGSNDPSLLVYGSISSPLAMPNYIKPPKKTAGDDDPDTKVQQPTVYDTQNVHLVRASNISSEDPVGDFEAELLSAGAAIIHNKIIVIDPFSDNPVAILGSHNLGFKASYGNDENLVIIQNNKALVQSYAVHVLDIYEHYRFRAVQQEMHDEGKTEWDGFLSVSDGWLEQAMSATGKGTLADYICGG
jgi:phosphatidylserine/phosphatidylglycerophosphate/cardiolipin synthase-like enzyme